MYKNLLFISVAINLLFLAGGIYLVHRYGGIRQVIYKIKNPGVMNLYHHRQNMFENFPAKNNAIVFLGNSITSQGEWAELFNRSDIQNRGIPGDHCDGIRNRLPAIVKSNPSKIFLMAGINDLAYHDPETVFKKYRQLVDAIQTQAPVAQLFLQSVLPVNNKAYLTLINNSGVISLNNNIRKLAEAKHLTFIDLYPLLLDSEGNLDAIYTLDGIHLNGLAYLKWKAAIEQYVID
jgi:lysophospholipase L1-like esterase